MFRKPRHNRSSSSRSRAAQLVLQRIQGTVRGERVGLALVRVPLRPPAACSYNNEARQVDAEPRLLRSKAFWALAKGFSVQEDTQGLIPPEPHLPPAEADFLRQAYE